MERAPAGSNRPQIGAADCSNPPRSANQQCGYEGLCGYDGFDRWPVAAHDSRGKCANPHAAAPEKMPWSAPVTSTHTLSAATLGPTRTDIAAFFPETSRSSTIRVPTTSAMTHSLQGTRFCRRDIFEVWGLHASTNTAVACPGAGTRTKMCRRRAVGRERTMPLSSRCSVRRERLSASLCSSPRRTTRRSAPSATHGPSPPALIRVVQPVVAGQSARAPIPPECRTPGSRDNAHGQDG